MTEPNGLSPNAIPRHRLGIRVRRFRGDIFVAVDDEAFELAESAGFIFTTIDGKRSLAETAGCLAAEYGIEEAEAYEDTCEFVSWLRDQKLIDIDDIGDPASADVAQHAR